MKIHLSGVRGSISTSGPETAYYGGNTSCVDVQEDGWLLVLDGGTGIQNLNATLSSFNRIDILLTHLHLDHIQGLGFFRPLFNPAMEIHIWGPASSAHSLRARLSRYWSPPLFPVRLRDLPCKLSLHEIGNSDFEIGPFKIQSAFVIHPGPTVGFRIMSGSSSFTYIPDHEPGLGNGIIPDREWLSGLDLASGTDLLLHDAQYTEGEYESRKGWGHSTIEDAALFASLAQVKKLLFFHHDPTHSDSQLDELSKAFHQKFNYQFTCEIAREGMEITLGKSQEAIPE